MAKRNARSRKPKPRRSAALKKKTARKPKTRKPAPKKAAARKKARPKARRESIRIIRPKPAALSRPRRRLSDEDVVIPSAPSTLGYAPKASSAESGREMYQQRQRQHS